MNDLPVLKTDTCWLWQGTLTNNGYGVLTRQNQSEVAHRYVYKLLGHDLPRELTLDHLCAVKHCVNPEHLEPVTQKENSRRYYASRPATLYTHCKRGHEFTPENTLHYTRKNGRQRRCRQCKNAWDRAKYRASR